MSNALTVINSQVELMNMADIFAKSGMFQSSTDPYRAAVKIQAGQELGIPPFAAMSQIHIIKGKPVIGGNAVTSLIKKHPRYDYRVPTMTNERVNVIFYENGDEVGQSLFTMEDAQRAKLTHKDNWKMYPRNMMFARAISNGARWYCPDFFGGSAVYTEDEITVDYKIIQQNKSEIIDYDEQGNKITLSDLRNEADREMRKSHNMFKGIDYETAKSLINLPNDPCVLAVNAETLTDWCENAYNCGNVSIAFNGLKDKYGKIEAWYIGVVGQFTNNPEINEAALIALQSYSSLRVDILNGEMSKEQRKEATKQAFEHSKRVYNDVIEAGLFDEEE